MKLKLSIITRASQILCGDVHPTNLRTFAGKSAIILTAAMGFQITGAHAADLYWNGGNISANPANGGTGTWSTTNAWRSDSATGSQATWAAAVGGTDNAFLAGTAGIITLGTSGSTNFTGANMTVNTSGYSIASSSSGRNLVFSGTLTTATDVALELDLNNTNATWGFGSMSLGTGSVLTIKGIATANNANRVNLSSGSTSSGGSITLAGTAAGPTGFVGTASGVILNTNITNNSATSATMLGATNGNSLTYGGKLTGSANLQISAGQSTGAGTVIINNSTNDFIGNTYLNAATNGVTRMGVDNALPSGTTIFFGASAGGGTADNGGSIDLNGKNLAVGALDKSANPSQGVANNTSTLSTLTIGKASGTNTFAGIIGTVTNSNLTTQSNNIALVKTGASTQILSGSNTYTGTTTVNDGILALSGTGTLGTGNITLGGGTLSIAGISTSTYSIGAGQSLLGSGDIDATGKTLEILGTLAPGSSAGTIDLTGSLSLGPASISNFEINGLNPGDFDQVNVSGLLTLGGTLNLITTGSYSNGDFVQLFDAGSFDGTFASITGTDLGGGLSWDTSALSTSGTITVIPEPTAALLGSLGLLTLLRRRR
jgi:autotransporter-associated beta strand protein